MITIKNLKQTLENFPLMQNRINAALRETVNATATRIRTVAIKRIQDETGLDKDLVSDKIEINRAKASKDNLEAIVEASNKRITLSHYDPIASFRSFIITRGTVNADISMLRSRQIIEDRKFINIKHSKIPFQREGSAAFPISVPTGPSVGHHMSRITDDLIEKGNEVINGILEKRLYKQLLR